MQSEQATATSEVTNMPELEESGLLGDPFEAEVILFGLQRLRSAGRMVTMLTREETTELFGMISDSPDTPEAAASVRRVAEAYLPFALSYATRVQQRNSDIELDDLVGEALLALTETVYNFAALEDQRSFPGYLTEVLNTHLGTFILKERYGVGDSARSWFRDFLKARNEVANQHVGHLAVDKIASATGLHIEDRAD